MSVEETPEATSERSVLEVFGLKLEVSNPRVAEILTSDAGQALDTEVQELPDAGDILDAGQQTTDAVPDLMLDKPSAQDDRDEAQRGEFRDRLAALGSALGFEVEPNGLWRSDTGLSILTRGIERPVSLDTATHFAMELSERGEVIAGSDSSILFVTEGVGSRDVFKVAIRQRRLYDLMRVIWIEDLASVGKLYSSGAIDHTKAVLLLAPVSNIDAGEILSVISAASVE